MVKFRRKIGIVIAVAIVIIAGLFLRTVWLNDFPAGLHFDEAQAGYNAKLIWDHQKNIAGQSWPIYIDSFGDYRPALISYLSAPVYAFFGLAKFVPRVPTAIFGALLVGIAFLFGKIFYKSDKLGLLAAVLTAVSSYGIIMSRGTLEGVIDVFFTLLAVLCTVSFAKKPRILPLFFVYIFLLLGYFSYMTSRVLGVPFILVTAVLGYLEYRPGRKILLVAVPIVLYLLFPWFFFFSSPIGKGRFSQTSVFSYPETQMAIDEGAREDRGTGNAVISRLFHNKPAFYATDIARRYLTYFSPNPMTFEMKFPTRHFFPGIPPLYLVEFLGVVLAATSVMFARKKQWLSLIPLALLLLAPIPAALTVDDFPNFSRIVFFVPLVQIVAVWGWGRFLEKLGIFWRAGIMGLLVVVTAVQFGVFLHQYFVHGPKHLLSIESRATQMEEFSRFLFSQNILGKKVALAEYDGPYIYYYYFNNLDIFQTKVTKTKQYFSGDYQIDNLHFFEEKCVGINNLVGEKFDTAVFWEGCLAPKSLSPVKSFYRTDGSFTMAAYDLSSWKEYQEYLSAQKTGLLEDPGQRVLYQNLLAKSLGPQASSRVP